MAPVAVGWCQAPVHHRKQAWPPQVLVRLSPWTRARKKEKCVHVEKEARYNRPS